MNKLALLHNTKTIFDNYFELEAVYWLSMELSGIFQASMNKQRVSHSWTWLNKKGYTCCLDVYKRRWALHTAGECGVFNGYFVEIDV